MKRNKGMTMALTLIVAAVVLIVIGLLIITITSGSLTNFINKITHQSETTSCDIWKANYCITHPDTETAITPSTTLGAPEDCTGSFNCKGGKIA